MSKQDMSNQDSQVPSAPWWSYGYVWMVLGGPAVVVVASMVTIWLAVSSPDPLVDQDYYRSGIEINKTLDSQAGSASLAPAQQARNHAAKPQRPASP